MKPGITSIHIVLMLILSCSGSGGGGSSGSNDPVPGDTAPPMFNGIVSVRAVSATEIELAWETARDNRTAPENIVYRIYMGNFPNLNRSAEPDYMTTGVEKHRVTGLTEGVSYFFCVNATDESGNIDANTKELSAVLDATPPDFGGPVSAVSINSETVELTWSAATDNVTPQSGILYDIYYAADYNLDFRGFNAAPDFTTAPGALSFRVTGLSTGYQYRFRVRARDGAGNVSAPVNDLNAVPVNSYFFTEHFEPLVPPDWTPWYTGAPAAITLAADTGAGGSAWGLRISAGTAADAWGVSRIIGTARPTDMGFYLKGTSSQTSPVLDLRESGSPGGAGTPLSGTTGIVVLCDAADSGTIIVNSFNTMMGCNDGAWHLVEIRNIDYSSSPQIFDVWVDGMEVRQGVSFMNAIRAGFDLLSLWSWGGSGSVWFDEIGLWW